MLGFVNKLFDSNDKQIKKLQAVVLAINELEEEFAALSDEGILAKTAEFKERYASGESLDALLPEAFANVREASKRATGMRHFDVQLIGGIVLHQGKIAEMKTGEGKTLVATLPLYLNALAGKGAHLVTVNGYLAQLGTGWNGPVYHKLGMSVAAIDHDLSVVYDPAFVSDVHEEERLRHLRPVTRRDAYASDITYGTNNEYGFDYLRDNMVQELDQMSQRSLFFAIVDEVDSILIDEARTPLIISAPAEESNELYIRFAKLVKQLRPEDYLLDEKSRSTALTESGADKMDKWLGVTNLYDDFTLTHHLDQAMRATYAYALNKDYVVRDGEVVIVDEFTGRMMAGRRYSEGLHQAIEAKEVVEIQKESKTLATITFQNYFRLYEKLSGMTGTAETEAEEFAKIYSLDVVSIPTNQPMVRQDLPDYVYKNQRAKYAAVIADIIEKNQTGQPVLVGTTSVERNEMLAELLVKQRIPHEVLNAKNNEREAEIVSHAGEKGAITIATNLAGRGTDIQLAEGVVELGGLHVIGTERHESRRIDNQLRGRSGRQGDMGSSRFYVALDDDLMRLFGGERIAALMERFNLPEEVPIENPLVSRSIESAQVKVEGHNFDIRKHVVEYDDVINKQREIIYARRLNILESLAASKAKQANPDDEGVFNDPFDTKQYILDLLQAEATGVVAAHVSATQTDIAAVVEEVEAVLPRDMGDNELVDRLGQFEHPEQMAEALGEMFVAAMDQRERQLGPELSDYITRMVMLETMDRLWMEHIDIIDELRTGIGLRGYGQRDPLIEFKNEAYRLFEQLMGRIDYEIVHAIFKVQIVSEQPNLLADAVDTKQELSVGSVAAAVEADALMLPNEQLLKTSDLPLVSSVVSSVVSTHNSRMPQAAAIDKSKLGRNDPCWCGSGKKYKSCHWPN